MKDLSNDLNFFHSNRKSLSQKRVWSLIDLQMYIHEQALFYIPLALVCNLEIGQSECDIYLLSQKARILPLLYMLDLEDLMAPFFVPCSSNFPHEHYLFPVVTGVFLIILLGSLSIPIIKKVLVTALGALIWFRLEFESRTCLLLRFLAC